jgi:pimeloyl-ACP methyl ester carboxylesterase
MSPYLLVGHSLGGHIVRAFAARHRADVVGMILVDARHEDLDPELPKSFLTRLAELAPDASARASHADWIGDAFGLGQGDLDRAEAAWQQYQRKLPDKSSRSKFCVATASGHLIPADQPEVVVSEIQALTDQCGI